jgi:hypothetical protein
MTTKNPQSNAAAQLLQVLAAIDPVPMDFSNILGKEHVDEDIRSGTTAWLLSEGLIEEAGKKYNYRITAKGRQRAEGGDSQEPDEDVERYLMPSLQPHNWEHRQHMVNEPLLEHGTKMGADIPLLTIGMDKPDVFDPIHKTPNNEKNYAVYRAAAMKNITRLDVKRGDVDMGSFRMTVVTGSYYAAEKVFDKEYMRRIQADLGVPMLAVGLPRKGTMYITNGILPPDDLGKFMQVIGFKYSENEQTKPLSRTVFIVQDGTLNGVIQPRYDEGSGRADKAPEGGKRSFWGKLFGKG